HASLAETDERVLAPFTLERVMAHLVATADVRTTPRDLWRQWWETQSGARNAKMRGPHCDDEKMSNGVASRNGFEIVCPAQESFLASIDPFDPVSRHGFIPIGIFNRFDLTPTDGSNCGEYRMIFAKRSGVFDVNDRALAIFEAVMPNPHRELGVEGCRPLAQFFARQTELELDEAARSKNWERFFFDGIGEFPAALDAANFTKNGGRVRTNQFMFKTPDGLVLSQNWRMYQFSLVRRCDAGGCDLVMQPALLSHTPMPSLLNDPSLRGQRFRIELAALLPHLAVEDANAFYLDNSSEFDAGQISTVDDFVRLNETSIAFLRTELARIGSPLTPEQAARRLNVLTCGGCHLTAGALGPFADIGYGEAWPQISQAFVQVSESSFNRSGFRYGMSNALETKFVPHRVAVLEAFLNHRVAPAPGAFARAGDPSPPSNMTLGGPRRGD
ncbi:MAG TPA: hypothetical protein VN605_03135, partial [Thermoanaerobaculia bacterium]|nr:hypothetical protein [Thermoanaerobaculia bacterium]